MLLEAVDGAAEASDGAVDGRRCAGLDLHGDVRLGLLEDLDVFVACVEAHLRRSGSAGNGSLNGGTGRGGGRGVRGGVEWWDRRQREERGGSERREEAARGSERREEAARGSERREEAARRVESSE